ncbi:MAG TPA: hypothetical protein VI756_23930 [Blastocatellia bacterium]
MKYFTQRFLSLFLLAVFVLPAQGGEYKKTLNLTRDSFLGGQMVKKGSYAVMFTDEENAEIDLTLARNEILKARCRAIHLSEPMDKSSVTYEASKDGTFKVTRIDFQGLKSALVFE